MEDSKKVFVWITSILMIIMFITLTPFTLANILLLIAGLIIMPPILNIIRKKTDKFTNKAKWITFSILFVIAIFIYPSSNIQENTTDNLASYENIITSKENNEIIVTNYEKEQERIQDEEDTKKEVEEKANQEEVVETQTQTQTTVSTQKNNSNSQTTSTQQTISTSTTQTNVNQQNGISSSSQSNSNQQSTSTSSSQSNSNQQSASSSTTQSSSNNSNGKVIYRTPSGKRYHFDPDCGGKNSYSITLDAATSAGLTSCQKCAQ